MCVRGIDFDIGFDIGFDNSINTRAAQSIHRESNRRTMAFILTPLPVSRARTTRAACPQMSANPRVSRRGALRLAGLMATGAASAALAGQFDLKELKEDVEALQYDEEVTDVGPDPQEKQVLRTKKKKEEPKFRTEEKKQLKEEEDKYDAMVAKELEDEAKLKAQFSKN